MADITSYQRAMAQAVERQGQLSKLYEPSRALAEAIKAFHPPHMRAVSEAIEAMQRQNELYSTMIRPPKYMEDIARQMSAAREVLDQITSPFAKVHSSLCLQLSVFEKLSTRAKAMDFPWLSISQLSQTAFSWNFATSSLANQMQEVGLLAQRQSLAARLLTAPNAYSEFVQKATDRLATAPSLQIASIIRGSLNLAEEQLLGISDSLGNFLAVPDDDDEPGPFRILTAPFDQLDDLLEVGEMEDEDNTHFLASTSRTALAVELSRRVLQLVIQCNEASKTSTIGTEIFKPTTRLLEVYSDLPWLVASNKKGLAEFVDCLYFIFYEGAGKDNLRFMSKNGGPLDDGDCDLIWCIKHLRNKLTRHDADHGKDKDIQKSWSDLAAKFRWLGIAKYPTSEDHFRILHQRLLELAAEFLAQILIKLHLK